MNDFKNLFQIVSPSKFIYQKQNRPNLLNNSFLPSDTIDSGAHFWDQKLFCIQNYDISFER